MSFIETIPAQSSTGEVRAMYERQQSAWGYVPNYAKVFSHRPEVLARWGRLLAEIRRPMDDRLFELATFAAAIELRNSACSLAHGHKLAQMIGNKSVQELAVGQYPENITESEIEVVNFARKVARDASTIQKQDLAGLQSAGYSDAEIFDVATTVAGRSFLTKLLDSLGVQADSVLGQLDDDFRKTLTVGRPVSEEDVELI
jgi:uncharacterized peroxidase-related enzyme